MQTGRPDYIALQDGYQANTLAMLALIVLKQDTPPPSTLVAWLKETALQTLNLPVTTPLCEITMVKLEKHLRSTKRIPDDEPVFLLRAQDAAAPTAVRAWIEESQENGVKPELLELAELQLWRMKRWNVKKSADATDNT